MAGRLMRLLFRPGWRLRCVDPPIAWVRLSEEAPPKAAIRLQLTCYLTSRYAGEVRFKDAQLRVVSGERTFIVPLSRVTEIDGESLEKGFEVHSAAPVHILAVFESDAPDLVSLLREPGPPLAIDVEALLNVAIDFRKIADLDLARPRSEGLADPWQQVDTGRAGKR